MTAFLAPAQVLGRAYLAPATPPPAAVPEGIVNDRDVLLENAQIKVLNAPGAGVLLIASTPVFRESVAGVVDPEEITFTATLVGLVGTVSFSSTGTTGLVTVGKVAKLTRANMTGTRAAVTAHVTVNGQTFSSNPCMVGVTTDGTPGEPGTPGLTGNTVAQAFLYIWSTVTPENPLGTATFTPAAGKNTAYDISDGWTIDPPPNPNVALAMLWVAVKPVSAPAGTASVPVTYEAGASIIAYSRNGADGLPGIKSAQIRAYRWGNGPAPAIAGTSTYSWPSSTYDNVPISWSITKPAAPGPGYTLFEATVNIVETAGAGSSQVDWTTAAIVGTSYIGLNGSGSSGDSAMIAYTLVDGVTLNVTPDTITKPAKGRPVSGDWGSTRAWTAQPSQPTLGQAVMQSNGIYNGVLDEVVWGVPYLSNWRVGTLSAITANMGAINAGSLNIGAGNSIIDINGFASFRKLTVYNDAGQVMFSSQNGLTVLGAAPGTLNTEAAFSPKLMWEFRNTLDGFTYANLSLTTGPDSVTLTSTAGDPTFTSPAISIPGGTFDKVRVRIKRKALGTWQGTVFYGTPSRSFDGSYHKTVPDTTKLNEWVTIEWDMATLTSGGSDWTASTITRIRLDFGINGTTDVFEVDWVAIGKYAPPNIRDIGFTGDLDATYTNPNKGAAINEDPTLENMRAWVFPSSIILKTGTVAAGASGLNFFSADAFAGGNLFASSVKRHAIDPYKTYNLTANLFVGPGNDREMYIYVQFYDAAGVYVGNNVTGWGGSLSGYVYGGLPPQSRFSVLGGDFGVGTSRPIPASVRSAEIGVWFQYAHTGSSSVQQGAQDIRLTEVTAVRTAQATADAKLSKTAADILSGPVTLQSNGAIIAGSLTVDANGYRSGGYGVGISQRGMVAYNSAGTMTFQLDASSGSAYYAGQLSGAYGTFGAVSVAAGGSLGIGATGFNTDTGIWFGHVGGVPKMSIRTVNGTAFLYDGNALVFIGDITARSFSTIGGRFSANAAGEVRADLVDINRRLVLQTGTLDATETVSGSYFNTADGAYYSHPPGTVLTVDIGQIVLADIYDSSLYSTSGNQPYYVAAHFHTTTRNKTGSGESTLQFVLNGKAESLRTFSNSGNYGDNTRICITFTATIKIISGSFDSFRLPLASWILYKL